ncbi:hypothetical protein [Nostoc sp. FACHB-280]|nr:hypothetical protein [Nostoc sp. FACHB-280]
MKKTRVIKRRWTQMSLYISRLVKAIAILKAYKYLSPLSPLSLN